MLQSEQDRLYTQQDRKKVRRRLTRSPVDRKTVVEDRQV